LQNTFLQRLYPLLQKVTFLIEMGAELGLISLNIGFGVSHYLKCRLRSIVRLLKYLSGRPNLIEL
jgi:hypothetical protein